MSGEQYHNGVIYNSTKNQTIGKINGDRICNNTGTSTLGKVNGNRICNSTGTSTLGKVEGDRVLNSTGTHTIGHVRDFTIKGMEYEPAVKMVAAYHFLVKKIF